MQTFLFACKFYKSQSNLNYQSISDTLLFSIEQKKHQEFETRMIYIRRIFLYEHELGIDKKVLKYNRFYYNDRFDEMYSLPIKQVSLYDQKLHGQYLEYLDSKRQELIKN